MKGYFCSFSSIQGIGRVLIICGVCVAGVSTAPGAHAQWIVNDPPHTVLGGLNEANNYTSLSSQIKEYAETSMRWKQTWDHYQQQIAKITSLAKALQGVGVPGASKLKRIDEGFGIEQLCGGGGGWSISGLKQVISSALTKNIEGSYANIVEEQRKVCAMKRVIENMKYNASVDYVNETIPTVNSSISGLLEKFGGKLSQGDQDQFQSDLLANGNDMRAKNEQFAANMKAYDAYVTALDSYQRTLATTLLKGNKGKSGLAAAVGAAINTAVLAEALDVDVGDIIN